MSYDPSDAAMDEFYDRISEELYPEHKEQAIDEFLKERLHSYYLKNPTVIQPPFECYHHANTLIDVSSPAALLMYTTSIELFLKSVLLKPVLYGMINNELIADAIVDASTGRAGFDRYRKLLRGLCLHAAKIELDAIKGVDGKPFLVEAGEVQKIRNDVAHKGYMANIKEMGKAKSLATLAITEVVEPVLNNMELAIGEYEDGFGIVRAMGKRGIITP